MRHVPVTLICTKMLQCRAKRLPPEDRLSPVPIVTEPKPVLDLWHMFRNQRPVPAKPIAGEYQLFATDGLLPTIGPCDLHTCHGVRVPEHVVTRPESITVEEIEAEPNAEVRRVMTDRYGWERYLADTGAEVIAMDSVPIESWNESAGSIERALVQTKAGARYLIACDGSTDRTYTLRAPDDAETPEDAYRAVAGASSDKCLAQG